MSRRTPQDERLESHYAEGDASANGHRTSWPAPDLLAEVFAEPKYAVDGVLAEGLNLLAGPPKIGKSWLALCIAVAVALGGTALGKIPVQRGDVLYLGLEDTARRLQRRLRLVLGGDAPPAGLCFETAWPGIGDGGAERLRDWLTEHPGARLVVVDVLAKVRGPIDDRTARYDADYAVMNALKVIADEFAVSILVLHHTRKATSEDFLDSVSGTQGLAGAADAVLILRRARGAADAVLHLTGRDIEEAERPLCFDPSRGSWLLLDGTVAEHEMSSERRKILDAVRRTEGIGPKAIALASGVAHDVVKQLVRKMVGTGELDTDGDGRYFEPKETPA